MQTPPDLPRFSPAGDQALVVELGAGIDRASNALVRGLDVAIRAAALPGIRGTVPSYRSLLVYYHPGVVGYASLVDRLRTLLVASKGTPPGGHRWELPVLYGEECREDLDALADKLQLSTDAVIQAHTAPEYMVYMMGFSPGFAYLGELPPCLEVPRKTVPAKVVPANSIQIGGAQTAVSSMPMPSGWYVVGRTPARMFDLRRDRPFLLASGDRVKFVPIEVREFAALCADAEAGRWMPREVGA